MKEKRVEFRVTKKDFELSWFSGTGSGGQHRNKHMNCCRLKHKHTGIIKTGQSSKDRNVNKREALQAMINDPRFMSYCNMKLKEIETGVSIEEEVEKMMQPENIKVEIKVDGEWRTEENGSK